MFDFVIGRDQAREFAMACSEQIIKEIAAAENHGKELTNNESESKDRMDKAA